MEMHITLFRKNTKIGTRILSMYWKNNLNDYISQFKMKIVLIYLVLVGDAQARSGPQQHSPLPFSPRTLVGIPN